ncbi:MAG: BlaI/MecI/CopY family transcriptional regulator [Bacteroidota bacterium]|nr:BlaI/MecI/CopY family transcriptional regulator [Bacteroidota bacterium]
MRELTKAEEQIMHILWRLEKGFVHDILERIPDPKPAYNTVSTIVRILEKKGVVGHKAYGKTHEYYPIISKKDYTRSFFSGFVKNYFGNSYKAVTSFFAKEENLSLQEMEEIKQLMEEKIKEHKDKKSE